MSPSARKIKSTKTEEKITVFPKKKTKLTIVQKKNREDLISYLSQAKEKADEDKILTYFRDLYSPNFKRQSDAEGADGYVEGKFILELKGKTNDWLAGFFQALAYRTKGLEYSLIVVACKNFLAVWNIKDIKDLYKQEILKLSKKKAPSVAGKKLAKQYSSDRSEILQNTIFKLQSKLNDIDTLNSKLDNFENTLQNCKKVRSKITINNFCSILKKMTDYFNPNDPKKAVRAFYSMLFGWSEDSILKISERDKEQATLNGAFIEYLIPEKRSEFKEFVENHYIFLNKNEAKDDFFAKYDIALDAVDKDFRKKHGIFFTDLSLSKLAMWFVRQKLGDIGKDYLVIDPACGSGNLVTNWKSPLELRHKVVSEIEPELLYAVEKRMKGDAWHNGKFTVVPKVNEKRGLNFLDKSAEDYLSILTSYLKNRGLSTDKPIAFLCNPPYSGTDRRGTNSIPYKIHKNILDITGQKDKSERYCAFLAQMKLVCKIAKDKGLPQNSLLLLFTKTAWLTQKKELIKTKKEILSVFQDIGGFIVNSKEFFDVKGTFPVAFTIWEYKGENAQLDNNREIELIDLTYLKKSDLSKVKWESEEKVNNSCKEIEKNGNRFKIGRKQLKDMQIWLGQKRDDFAKDGGEKDNNNKPRGLPKEYKEKFNKMIYGETKGDKLGFLDNLTPCRFIPNKQPYYPDKPCFLLDKQFMNVRINRCFSAPAYQKNFFAFDLESAKKTFFWYSLCKTFATKEYKYPLYIDNENLWPIDEKKIKDDILKICFSIGFAENDCIEATFPENNPIEEAPEITLNNPMTPLNEDSFWCEYMNPILTNNLKIFMMSLYIQ